MNPITTYIEQREGKTQEEFQEWYSTARSPVGDTFPATTEMITDYFLAKQRTTLTEVLRMVREAVGEKEMKREGIKVGTGIIMASEIESGVVIGTNQERKRILSLLSPNELL